VHVQRKIKSHAKAATFTARQASCSVPGETPSCVLLGSKLFDTQLTKTYLLPATKICVCTNSRLLHVKASHIRLIVGRNVDWVSNSLEPDETLSYSGSRPGPSYLHMELLSQLAGKGLKVIFGSFKN